MSSNTLPTPVVFTDDCSVFDEVEQYELDELIIQGRTLRYIQQELVRRNWKAVPTLNGLLSYLNSKTHLERIQDWKAKQEEFQLRFGLARRAVRVSRLTDLAEKLEKTLGLDDAAVEFKPSPRLVALYLDTMKSIGEEMAPKLGGAVDPDNTWEQITKRQPQLSTPTGTSSQSSSPSDSIPAQSSSQSSTASIEGTVLQAESVQVKAGQADST